MKRSAANRLRSITADRAFWSLWQALADGASAALGAAAGAMMGGGPGAAVGAVAGRAGLGLLRKVGGKMADRAMERTAGDTGRLLSATGSARDQIVAALAAREASGAKALSSSQSVKAIAEALMRGTIRPAAGLPQR